MGEGLGQSPIVALHASAVVTPAGALLFLGHAEAGKSTIRQLLASHFPSLADDSVYLLRQENGSWQATNADQCAFAGPLKEGEIKADVVGLAQELARRKMIVPVAGV